MKNLKKKLSRPQGNVNADAKVNADNDDAKLQMHTFKIKGGLKSSSSNSKSLLYVSFRHKRSFK